MDQEEEWLKPLVIPGVALPGLRDLRIRFVALIEFDLMLGPVAYINELQDGSSYVKKLKDYQTLSEVYAGVARSPQHTLSTLEEDIAVFRHTPEGKTDITTVFFISCLPKTDLDPIRELGQKAIFRSKGNPSRIGRELSLTLREKLSVDKRVKRNTKADDYFIFLDENRIQKSFQNEFVRGLVLVDLKSKQVDLRNLSEWIDGTEIKIEDFLLFLDNQINSIKDNKISSLIYQDIPFLFTKVEDKQIYIGLHISEQSIPVLFEIISWFKPFVMILEKEWKQTTRQEIQNALQLFDEAKSRKTPLKNVEVYTQMLLFSDRIKPANGAAPLDSISSPVFISTETWNNLMRLKGNQSLNQIAKSWNINIIDLITLMEWARIRKIVEFTK